MPSAAAPLIAAALVVPTFLLDDPVRDERASLDLFQEFDEVGRGEMPVAASVLFYAGGWAADSERGKRVGVVIAEASIANALVTAAFKGATGRARPYLEDGPGKWSLFSGNFGNRNSFPSGHTSTAFTVAAVVAEEYDSLWVDAASYGLAGLAGVSRIAEDKHWTSDVVAGAAVGILVGKGVSRWERSRGMAKRLYTDGRGLYFLARF